MRGIRRRDQTARRFRLGALRVFRRHQPIGFVPLNLGELGLVQRDADVAAPNPARRSCQRPKDADDRAGGEQGENQPQHGALIMIARALARLIGSQNWQVSPISGRRQP